MNKIGCYFTFIGTVLLLFLFLPSFSYANLRFYNYNLKVFKLFGQISYKEGSRNTVTAHSIYHGAGVRLDHSSTPNHIYVVDTGNNRILGFKNLGYCQNTNRPCTADSDCNSNQCVVSNPKEADLVLGQPDFIHAACNHDVNKGVFTFPGPDTLCFVDYPIAANIAEMWQRVNIDVDDKGNLYVPDYFNNRVLIYKQPFSPDKTNGKGDTIADYVIGQPDFFSNLPNQGKSKPDATTLKLDRHQTLIMSRGVSVDKYGNVWVADTFNSRVLRFPASEITAARRQNRAPKADLVLGQPNFHSNSRKACFASLNLNRPSIYLCQPTLARLHPVTNELYVLDETMKQGSNGRPLPFQTTLVVFTPDKNGHFRSGQSYSRIIRIKQPLPFEKDPAWPTDYFLQATSFDFNLPNHGYYQHGYQHGTLWLIEHQARRVLLIDNQGNIIKVIGTPQQKAWTPLYKDVRYRAGWQWDFCWSTGYCLWPGGSFDFDNQGNIYLTDEISNRVVRFKLPFQVSLSFDNHIISFPSPSDFVINKQPGITLPNTIGPHKFDMTNGIIATHNQLILRDNHRFLVWPDYLNASWQDNFIVGQSNPYTNQTDPQHIGRAANFAVIGDKLWSFDSHGRLVVYQLPLQSSSSPLNQQPIQLVWVDNNQPVAYWGDLGIAYHPLLDALFIADTKHHRILVIKNHQQFNNSPLKVVMVIGQPNKNTIQCNHNQPDRWLAPGPATDDGLCLPKEIKIDKKGNLFVVENTYEGHGNNRISVWAYSDIRKAFLSNSLFPNLKAIKVFTQPSLTSPVKPRIYQDRPSSPVSIAFDRYNRMVIANDGSFMGYGYHNNDYDRQRPFRQLWFYQNPLATDNQGRYIQNQPADAYIDIPIGVPGGITFDDKNNLIVHDGTWSRVFIINIDCDPELVKSVNSNFTFQPQTCSIPDSNKNKKLKALDVNNNNIPADRGDIVCFIIKYLTHISATLDPNTPLYDPNNDHKFNRQDVILAITEYLKNPQTNSGSVCSPLPMISN